MAPLQNVQHIHFKITECFVDKGLVRQQSELGKKSLIDHNRRFTQGSAFLPPVHGEAMYCSLAPPHLNIALRCIRSGLLGSLAGILSFLPTCQRGGHIRFLSAFPPERCPSVH